MRYFAYLINYFFITQIGQFAGSQDIWNYAITYCGKVKLVQFYHFLKFLKLS